MKRTLKDPILLLLLIIGAFLIFANLGNIYLWIDEAETAVLAKNVLEFGYPRAFDGKNYLDYGLEYRSNFVWIYHPWIQFYLTAASFALLGVTNFTARLPFALSGVGSIFLTYILAMRLTNNRNAARLSTLLLVFSVPFILLVRQCRFYGLMIFFTLFLLLAYLDFIENRKGTTLKFIFASLLLLHTNHGTFVAVFGALIMHYLLFCRRSKRLKQVLPPLIIIGIGAVTWLYYSVCWQFFGFFNMKGWPHQPFNLKLIRQNFEYYVRLTNKYIVPAAFLSIVVIFRRIKNRINPFSSKAIDKSSLWLILLVIFCSLLLLIFVDVRFFRYISHLIPLLLILAALVLNNWLKSSKLLTVLVIVLILFTNFFNNPKLRFYLLNYFYEITHDYDGPNEGIVKYLVANAQPGQTIKMPCGTRVLLHYTDLIVEDRRKFSKETYPDWIIPRRDWLKPSFYKTNYFKQIQKRYEKIVLDYPDIMWGNRPDPGYHKFKTITNPKRSKVVIYKKK